MRKNFQEAIKSFEVGNYNEALRKFNEILKNNPYNKESHYYICSIYRQLKKWSKCKNYATSFLKKFGKDPKILEYLGEVYSFEGDYKKAIEMYKSALKLTSQPEDKNRLREKLEKTYALMQEKKSQLKLAVIVHQGGDTFTDDLVENLSKKIWVKKFVIPTSKITFLNALLKAKRKKLINDNLYKVILHFLGSKLRKIISWADVTWCEWADFLAVTGSYVKPKGKKLFVRLHRYEAFTDIPFMINWNNVDELVFVSQFMKDILEMRGLNLQKVSWRVIYNGIDLKRFQFIPRQKGYNIAWVAHIIPRKNLHVAFEIIKKLSEKDKRYRLHVAGSFDDPMYEIYLKHLAKSMKIKDNVIFHGWVDDINQWLEDKNYLLSTSIHESFGYNIVEAMARGIKPVIHDFYNAKELYDEEFLFSSVDEAVEKITEERYDSHHYREYIIKRGWTLEKQVKEFESLINELVSR
ncbi:glycosyltransferase [Thermotoga sp. KOL6]|uniref:glycosyltransferase n=1 Tax=Thermotoga sp. KOL6 TaxID=126741 RepID=UPI000CBBC9F0|nr:glycosyltransferase [Thermotoga sp. KOL6]PLV59321.1 hypothetical protein AS005_06165 [Thermotoga sp. KOL6]